MRSLQHHADCDRRRQCVVVPTFDLVIFYKLQEVAASYHRDNFRIRIEVKQFPCEFSSAPCVPGFCEDLNSTAQSNAEMRRLELTMREVRCEFKTSLDVVWLFLSNTTALELNRNTQQILASCGHCITPLHQET